MIDAKIYGLCLERIKHQVRMARTSGRAEAAGQMCLLESYETAEPVEIIDILDLYDVEAPTKQAVSEKLEDLAFSVSLLIREKIGFAITEEGHLGLYLMQEGPAELVGVGESTLSAR